MSDIRFKRDPANSGSDYVCDKHAYPNRYEADQVLKAIKNKRKNRRYRKMGRDEIRSYKCPTCPNWHLTSMV